MRSAASRSARGSDDYDRDQGSENNAARTHLAAERTAGARAVCLPAAEAPKFLCCSYRQAECPGMVAAARTPRRFGGHVRKQARPTLVTAPSEIGDDTEPPRAPALAASVLSLSSGSRPLRDMPGV